MQRGESREVSGNDGNSCISIWIARQREHDRDQDGNGSALALHAVDETCAKRPAGIRWTTAGWGGWGRKVESYAYIHDIATLQST